MLWRKKKDYLERERVASCKTMKRKESCTGKGIASVVIMECFVECILEKNQKNNTVDSNVVPHRSTNTARACLTSLSGREAVLSCLYGRSWHHRPYRNIQPIATYSLNPFIAHYELLKLLPMRTWSLLHMPLLYAASAVSYFTPSPLLICILPLRQSEVWFEKLIYYSYA